MSLVSKNKINLIVSIKFQKELDSFFNWAKLQNYTPLLLTQQLEWNFDLFSFIDYYEPSRNKLDLFLKCLTNHDCISIYKDSIIINDYKLLSKEFKQSLISKKQKKPSKSNINLIIDNSLDTSKFFYLETLNTSLDKIIQLLGNPKLGNDYDDSKHEWAFLFNNKQYSIYDWKNKDGTFDDIKIREWHLSGTSKNKQNINTIKNLFDISSTPIIESVESVESVETKDIDTLDISNYTNYNIDSCLNFCDDVFSDEEYENNIINTNDNTIKYDDFNLNDLKQNFEIEEIETDLNEILNELGVD